MSNKGHATTLMRFAILTLLAVFLTFSPGSEGWAQLEKASPAAHVLKPTGDSLDFTVVEALTGNQLQVDSGETIILLGVVAPESAGPSTPADYYAKESTHSLNQRVKDQKISVTFSNRKTDSQGNWLGWVWMKDEVLLNELAVKEGWALADPDPNLDKIYSEALADAQESARETGSGMWKSPGKASRLANRIASRKKAVPTENLGATSPPPLGLQPPPPGGPRLGGAPAGGRPRGTVSGAPQTRIYQRVVPGRTVVSPGIRYNNTGVFALPPSTLAPAAGSGTATQSKPLDPNKAKFTVNYGPNGKIKGFTPQGPNNSKFYFSPTQPGLSNKPPKK